jgi:hypothetical protein
MALLVLAIAVAAVLSLLATPAAATGVEKFARHTAGSTAVIDHRLWDRLLKKYVKPDRTGLNRVEYAHWKKEGRNDLKAYLAALQAVDPTTLDRPEQFAYWANLYNARTIDIVLDKYPVKSIKDISLGGTLKALVSGGPWQAKVVKVAGVEMSLDDIEHNVLRPVFKDPRVHYAVNCASIGCPNLMTAAFTGATLEAQLDSGARAFINSERGLKFQGGKVWASSIFSWFQSDFGANAAAVLAHMANHAEPALKRKLIGITRIDEYGYDWRLNDAR